MRNDGRSLNVRQSQGGWVQLAIAAVGLISSVAGGMSATRNAKKEARAKAKINAIRNARLRAQRAQEISLMRASALSQETSTAGLWAGGTSARLGVEGSMLSQSAQLAWEDTKIQKLGGDIAAAQVGIQNGYNTQAYGAAAQQLAQSVYDTWGSPKTPEQPLPAPGEGT